jgi:IS5 family transposase
MRSSGPNPIFERHRISYLKRGYGWDRTRLDGREGASIWCGHGVFAHNLVKISALVG